MSADNLSKPERLRTGKAGQPAFDISKETLLELKEKGFTKKQMHEHLKVSEKTVQRNLEKHKISLRGRRCGKGNRAKKPASNMKSDVGAAERTADLRKTSGVQEESSGIGGKIAIDASGSASVAIYKSVPSTLGNLAEQWRPVASSLTDYGRAVDQPRDDGWKDMDHGLPSKAIDDARVADNQIITVNDGGGSSQTQAFQLRPGVKLKKNNPESSYGRQTINLSGAERSTCTGQDEHVGTDPSHSESSQQHKKPRLAEKKGTKKNKQPRKKAAAKRPRSSKKSQDFQGFPNPSQSCTGVRSPLTASAPKESSPKSSDAHQGMDLLPSDQRPFECKKFPPDPDVEEAEAEECDVIKSLVELRWDDIDAKLNGRQQQMDQLSRWCCCPYSNLQYPR